MLLYRSDDAVPPVPLISSLGYGQNAWEAGALLAQETWRDQVVRALTGGRQNPQSGTARWSPEPDLPPRRT